MKEIKAKSRNIAEKIEIKIGEEEHKNIII
jgi:hypothetical protein